MPISRAGAKNLSLMPGSQTGFSLIEAIVVTVVLGLMVALVSPVFISSYRGAVLKSTVRSTAASLRYVRASAIGAGETRALELDVKNRIISPVYFDPKFSSLRPYPIAPHINFYKATGGAYSSENEPTKIRFEFSPSGNSSGDGLIFAYGKFRYLVEVNPLTGKVKVSVSHGSSDNKILSANLL